LIEIYNTEILVGMRINDLWAIVITFDKYILLQAQTMQKKFRGVSEDEFLEYVLRNEHQIYMFIEKIYAYLNRKDLVNSLQLKIRQFYNENNISQE
jgi:hypothetical protein